jgi:hypothetical protein
MKPWKDVYRQVYPGAEPNWKSLDDARQWARSDKERVEPVVLRILSSEYDDILWTHGLLIASEIPTEKVRDVLFQRLEQMLKDVPDACLTDTTNARGAITAIIKILGQSEDARVGPIALTLALKHCQTALVVERCIEALQRVGGNETLNQLSDIPLRQRNEHIDHMAALTEKIIEARMEGKVFPPETAPEELRTVAREFVKALEDGDVAKFRQLFPAQMREHMGEDKLAELAEWNQKEQALPAIRTALDANTPLEIDRELDIDQEYFQAKFVCDNRFVLEFIYEIDGWKVMNVKPIPRPPEFDAPQP